MSGAGRQDFTDKAGAALKVCSPLHISLTRSNDLFSSLQPDSQKSTTEHVGDMFKGKTDSAASTVQPNVSGLLIYFPYRQLTPIIL